ncbi:histone deacetylase [Streptomyces abyssalis]|uniref:Histone deacetylase n=1 Tax=Streptomyces abyssalis TaxID=933944 RepID=A0A1E7JSU7_9ACTN|nr:histone deacetylase [Streptomyces abyssalis]OEU91972.1 histone deacetylase [Streptomyces abyssalis]OEU93885.1 histone deacetylase [Streptomyces abyssalis]OEV27656.1 histone deacetylase [Streptomyces nanshensis]
MHVPRQPGPPQREFTAPRKVWYAAFGSNMHRSRLDCYLTGGCPPGGRRAQPGCRDPRPPERALPVMLPGELYFALESPLWTGGTAFYDPGGEGRTAARAWLVTAGQFADIAAQEMHREPGEDLDLREVLVSGRHELGTGRYETLVCAGTLDGHPVLTFTAPWARAGVPGNPPAAAYLGHLASGLAESHGWSGARIGTYLATRPGAAGHWSAEAVAGLLPAPPGAPVAG